MRLQSCAEECNCVDLGESFQTHIFLQNLASIQPRTSPVKFARPSNAEASEVRRFSDPGSVPEDHGEADGQDHSLRGKLRDTARHVMMEEKAAKAMGMRSKVNKIRRKRGLPLNPEFEKLLGRA